MRLLFLLALSSVTAAKLIEVIGGISPKNLGSVESSIATSNWAEAGILEPRLATGACDDSTPCVNGACCSVSGFCGYSPAFCGAGNCTSNCNAKAQCGPYAVEGEQNCPLNVCCSQFG